MLPITLECLLALTDLSILALSSVLFSEVISACLFKLNPTSENSRVNFQATAEGSDLSLAVLVPAHNESSVIVSTIDDIQKQLSSQDRLLVIADNCTDKTAELARSTGATVIERNNRTLCGKGHALDYGVKALAEHPPDVVIMIDADCRLGTNAVFHLKQQALETNLPAQAIYLFEQKRASTLKASISLFAIKLKNWVRPQGLLNCNLSCLLTGSGMAFPWHTLSSVNLASGSIVEDMKLGLDLAIAGYPTKLCPQSHIYSTLPKSPKISTKQRTRWEHGHLRLLLEYVPKLFVVALKKKDFSLAVTMLDLAIPPLSLLVAVWFIFSLLSGILLFATALTLPLKISGLSGGLLLLSITISWLKFARQDISFAQILLIPKYILWKLPVYLKFLYKPQKQWIKTARDLPTKHHHID